MRTITKALTDLTKDEYRACHYLNLRQGGLMMYSLRYNRNNPNAYAAMVWHKDMLLGWALMVPHGDEINWYSSAYQRRKSKYVVQFYVRKQYRRKGVGARVMAAVNKLDSTPTVIPHDDHSARFFASYDVVTEADRRGMITRAKKNKVWSY